MTRRTNARVAGIAYIAYIAVAFPAMVLMGKATAGQGIPAKLAGIAANSSNVRIVILLSLVSCFAAFFLAVSLYAITRDVDPDLALIALVCRIAEGMIGFTSLVGTLGLLWLATGGAGGDPAGANALGAFLLKADTWSPTIAATSFAVGSTIFCWLLLRGRIVPVPLAGLGVLASLILVPYLPARLAGFLTGEEPLLIWIPMLVFEVTVGFWLIFKGAAAPATKRAAG
jgi:Domain of unknown function (DUF4386)